MAVLVASAAALVKPILAARKAAAIVRHEIVSCPEYQHFDGVSIGGKEAPAVKRDKDKAAAGCARFRGAEPRAASQERIGFLLNLAAARVRGEFAAALAPLGITPRHYGVLRLLAQERGLTQQEVGQRVYCDRTTMVSLTDDLERLGLAQRAPKPHDRRAHTICLTEKGRAAEAKARAIARTVETDFLRPLSDAGTRRLRSLLLRVIGGQARPTQGRRK
jgi:DNA-binding MarR family transcriptional regulator